MIKFIKQFLKYFIGVGVLILVFVVFFIAQRGTNLESGTLKNWLAASDDARTAAVQIVAASQDNMDLIVACVNKMATLPESAEFAITDAVRLCSMGIQLKENN